MDAYTVNNMLDTNPRSTVDGLIQAILVTYPGPIHAIGVEEMPNTLRPVGTRWDRLKRFLKGEPTWTMQALMGAVEFIIVHEGGQDRQGVDLVNQVIEYLRPACVVIRVKWIESCGGTGKGLGNG